MQACYEFGVLRSSLAAVLLTTFALALPAAALADSAGDNQYQDPFSNAPAQPKKKQQQNSTSTPQPTSGTTSTPTATPAPASQTPTATTAAPTSSDQGTLPRTGFPLWPAAAVGAALVAAGLVLRRLASDR